jgi:DNA-binding protein HU-beta
MNRTELIAKVHEILGKEKETATAVDATRAVTATIDAIVAGIKKDNQVQILGFGTFQVLPTAARIGVDPSTGQKIKIKASKRLKFKVGATLKEAVLKSSPSKDAEPKAKAKPADAKTKVAVAKAKAALAARAKVPVAKAKAAAAKAK